MAPPSKKQKWRHLDLSATEQYIDDAALHERVARLEASDSLFQIDTAGCAPANNLTQKARRLLQQRLLAEKDGKGEGGTAEPKTLQLVQKKPLIQAISKHHKKELSKVMKQLQGKEKENATAPTHVSPHPASSTSGKPLTISRSRGQQRKDELEDLWPSEDISPVYSTNSRSPVQEENHSEEQRDNVKKSVRIEHAISPATAVGAATSGEAQAPAGTATDSPAAVASSSDSSVAQQHPKEGESTQLPTTDDQKKQQARGKRYRDRQKKEPIAAARGELAPEAACDKTISLVAAEGAAVGAVIPEAGLSSALTKIISTGDEEKKEERRNSEKNCRKNSKKRLPSRRVKSFDELRPYIPAVRLPGDSESYNPSAEANACGLLAAAVRTLEEEREVQRLQRCNSRRLLTHEAHQRQDQGKLELLLWASMQQREIDRKGAEQYRSMMKAPDNHPPQAQGANEEERNISQEKQRECFRMECIDQVLMKVLPSEEVKRLSDTQKQRSLLELAYSGKVSLPPLHHQQGTKSDLASAQEQSSKENKEGKEEAKEKQALCQETDPLISRKEAADVKGAEEATGENKNDDASSDQAAARLFRTKKRPEKKTRADRNRRLRFLQHQRRRAAKLAARNWRAAVNRLDSLINQLKEEEENATLKKERREEKLRAKIQAAEKGFVRLKVGRNRFIEAPPAVHLPEDVSGNLRAAKTAVALAPQQKITEAERLSIQAQLEQLKDGELFYEDAEQRLHWMAVLSSVHE